VSVFAVGDKRKKKKNEGGVRCKSNDLDIRLISSRTDISNNICVIEFLPVIIGKLKSRANLSHVLYVVQRDYRGEGI
jgi:hypothetical protein